MGSSTGFNGLTADKGASNHVAQQGRPRWKHQAACSAPPRPGLARPSPVWMHPASTGWVLHCLSDFVGEKSNTFCTQKSFEDTRGPFPPLYLLTPRPAKKDNSKQRHGGEREHTVEFLLVWNEFGQTPGFVEVSSSICSDAEDHWSKQSKVWLF